MAAAIERELTHDELWDDSALVASWDEALEEYNKYHSLAARGEKVPEVKIPPKKQPLQSKAAAYLNGASTLQPAKAKPEPPSNPAPGNFMNPAPTFIGPAAPPKEQPAPSTLSASAASASLWSMPAALLAATSQDDNLRSMMMSWYYAGYHTGLYEGQQKALAQWQETLQQEQQQEGAGEGEG